VSRTIYIATRGSALALAQSNLVLAECRHHFPNRAFELKIIKTTGDKLQTINLTNPDQSVPKGLFTKELEVAMLNGEADFAVHSLKDLPTELPDGLYLSAVSQREDVRDVLIYRDQGKPGTTFHDFPAGSIIASSSTRRQAQVLTARPDLRTEPIRGNVGTRLQKLHDNPALAGTILALAGLKRLGYVISEDGQIQGRDVPSGLRATILPVEQMLPCVGQAALGFESRIDDKETDDVCAALNHPSTFSCVTAERSFLQSMGGGCMSPVAAYAELLDEQLSIRAVSFRNETVRRAELTGPATDARLLGERIARELL